jgi:tetratricopeptide (TPR) repeat protein
MANRSVLISSLLLLCFFSPSFSSAQGQKRKIDSMERLLATQKEDTNRVLTLNQLAYSLYVVNPDTTIKLAEDAMTLALKLNFTKGIANSYNTEGVAYRVKGNYPKALDCDQQALKLAEELSDKLFQAKILGNMGLIHLDQSDFPNALDYFLKALRIGEELNNKDVQSKILGNMGIVYNEEKKLDTALSYYKRALKLAEELGNKHYQANNLGNIGIVYYDKGDYDMALLYDEKVLKMDIEAGNKQGQGIEYADIAAVYAKLENYPKALENYQKSVDIDEEIGNKGGEGANYGDMGFVYTLQGNYKLAEEYLKKGIAMDSAVGDIAYLMQHEEHISHLYDTTGRYKLALDWYRKSVALKDTLFNQDRDKAITQKEMTYQFDKKETLEKAEQEKKSAIENEKLKKQKIFTYSVTVVLALVLLLAWSIFNTLQQNRKKTRTIEEQRVEVIRKNAVIEEKNKDILDSITYAKRLQDAILPPPGHLQEIFPDSFILYKPKDIVAGDFYWMEKAPLYLPEGETKNRSEIPPSEGGEAVLIAACDCTGHGVPGAMVSVVCSNALNRAVNEFNLTEPGRIFDKVRELVLETFKKSGEEVQDGMDASLCSINVKTHEVLWCGAYNPLWYIRNGEIIEMTPDKQPVGKTEKTQPFKTHRLELQKGDALYLFTDGFADQFGGPKGKKFKHYQFQKLVADNSKLSMKAQKEAMEKAFEEWKGNLEQTDDVCVIGIRI